MTDEEVKEEPEVKQESTFPVEPIQQLERGLLLVSYVDDGREHRVIVPAGQVKAGRITASALKKARPYGVAWEHVKINQITGEQLADALHNAGIWTYQDLQAKAGAAQGALKSLQAVSLSQLIGFAKTEMSNG